MQSCFVRVRPRRGATLQRCWISLAGAARPKPLYPFTSADELFIACSGISLRPSSRLWSIANARRSAVFSWRTYPPANVTESRGAPRRAKIVLPKTARLHWLKKHALRGGRHCSHLRPNPRPLNALSNECRLSRPPSAPTETRTENAFRDRRVVQSFPRSLKTPGHVSSSPALDPRFRGGDENREFSEDTPCLNSHSSPLNSKSIAMQALRSRYRPRPPRGGFTASDLSLDPAKNVHPRLDTFDIGRDHCGRWSSILGQDQRQIDPTLAYRGLAARGVVAPARCISDGGNTLAFLTQWTASKGDRNHASAAHAGAEGIRPRPQRVVSQYEAYLALAATDQPPPDRETPPSQRAHPLDGLWRCILCFCGSTSCQLPGEP